MKNLLLTFIVSLSPILIFANADWYRHNVELANSNIIALVEIINMTDSSLTLKVLDPIKGCHLGKEIKVKKPLYNSVPYGNWKTAKVGQKEVFYLDSINGYQIKDGHCEYDLLFRNDSVFIHSLAFQHGCFYKKYKDDRSIVYGSKLSGYLYQDFKCGILDFIKSQDKLIQLISKEKDIISQKIKQGNHGYNPRTGEIPAIHCKSILKFKSKSKFHERLIDELIDRELTHS